MVTCHIVSVSYTHLLKDWPNSIIFGPIITIGTQPIHTTNFIILLNNCKVKCAIFLNYCYFFHLFTYKDEIIYCPLCILAKNSVIL